MADIDHGAFEKQRHFDLQGFALPSVGVGMQHATVLTTQGAVMSHGTQTQVQLQVNANQGYSKRNAKITIILGALQVVAGFLAIAFQAAATAIEQRSDSRPIAQYFSCGIWCGTVFLITGILGIQAGRKNARTMIIALLVFSIVASLIVWILLAFAVSNLAIVETCPSRSIPISRDVSYYETFYNNGIPEGRLIVATHSYMEEVIDWSLCYGVTGKALKAMDCLLIIIGLFEFAVSVTTASLCCRARPCCANSMPVFLIQQRIPAPAADSYPYDSSMHPNILSQGSLVHGHALPNTAMEKTEPI